MKSNKLTSSVLSIESFLLSEGNDCLALIDGRLLLSRSELIAEILCLASNISENNEQNWALACDNTAAFIKGLVALLAAGKTVYLPANLQPGTLSEISQHAGTFLSDRAGKGFEGQCYQLEQLQKGSNPAHLQLRLNDASLIFFTSGSSGQPKAIKKHLWQLESEINAHQTMWGDIVHDSVTLACVAHQHIYGVLFRILWPLLAHRPIDTEQYEYPEHLLAAAAKHNNVSIIASPAQLERLPVDLDWSVCHNRVTAVYSSGAPLGAQYATQAEQCFSTLPIEVFGSTETAGVAWRQQSPEINSNHDWQLFPGVNTELHEGLLKVYSPWLDEPEAGFLMGDRAELLENGRFRLRGRADMIAKIEGKRVSLSEVALRLNNSPFVEKADVTVLERQRRQIGAVVVLTAEGQNLLASEGRLAVSRALKNMLSQHFEAVTIPRKWRYPQSLPINSQGKLVRSELARMFETGISDD